MMNKFISTKYKKIKRFLNSYHKIFIPVVLIISFILNIYMVYKLNNGQVEYVISICNIEINSVVNDNLTSINLYANNKYYKNLNWLFKGNSIYVPSKFINPNFLNTNVDSSIPSSFIVYMLEYRTELFNQNIKDQIHFLENIVSLLES